MVDAEKISQTISIGFEPFLAFPETKPVDRDLE